MINITTIGDSITQAENGRNSYRRDLWDLLTDAGHDVDFVGSENRTKDNTDFPDGSFDPDHEGHWGWRTDEIINGRYGEGNLTEWLTGYTPDIALVHLGSNDAIQGDSAVSTIEELEDVIDILRQDNPNVVIFIAQLIPTTNNIWNQSISELNSLIPALVADKDQSNSPVILVDQSEGFNASLDTYDGIHPDESGEAKIAQQWFAAINSYLTENSSTPIVGTENRDVLTGTDANDLIQGLGGNDVLRGNDGNDTIEGGSGNDQLVGEAGADMLDGGAGNDLANYIKSDASVVINLSLGTASGGHAAGDTLTNIERLKGSNFDDQLTGDAQNNALLGSDGNDILNGEAGNDQLVGEAGADMLDGGAGNDLANYIKSDAAVVIDLSLGTASGGHAAGDTFTSIERLKGSKFDDQLTGDDERNTLVGDDGNDILIGGGNRDTLVGNSGADQLFGGSDRDTFTIKSLNDSQLGSIDVIGDLEIGTDRINGPTGVEASDLAQLGAATSLTESAIQSVLTAGDFVSNGAATFTVGSQTYLALNDGTAGFKASSDSIIEITGFTGNLSALSVI